MRISWIKLLCLAAVCCLSLPVSAQTPTNTFKGKIAFVADSGQTAVVAGSSYVLVQVDESTYQEGLVEKGARATVIYRVGDNLALKIFTDREPPIVEDDKKSKRPRRPRVQPEEKKDESAEWSESSESSSEPSESGDGGGEPASDEGE